MKITRFLIATVSVAVALVVGSVTGFAQFQVVSQGATNYTSLNAAISAAAATDTINMTADHTESAVAVAITKNLSLRSDPVASPTVYTLTRGRAGDLISVGGGGSLTMSNIIIDGDKANFDPANGVLVNSSGGLVLSTGAVLRNNKSGVNLGGAVCAWTAVTMSGATVTGNESGGVGGGIFTNSTASVTNSEISNNIGVSYGGGIFVEYATTFDNVQITGNTTTGGAGGGIYAANQVTITNGSTVSGNTSSQGGAFYCRGVLTMVGGSVSGNTTSAAENISAAIHNVGGLNLSGSVNISDTIFNASGKFITVSGALSSAIPVKVWQMGADNWNPPANGTVVVAPDGTAVSDVTHFIWKDTNLVLNPAAITGNGGVVVPVFQLVNTRTGYLATKQAMLPSALQLVIGGTYSVTYDGNTNTGGTVPVDASLYMAGAPATAEFNTGALVKSSYLFEGWNTAADGSGTAYAEGASIGTISGDKMLFVHWTKNPISYTGGTIEGTLNLPFVGSVDTAICIEGVTITGYATTDTMPSGLTLNSDGSVTGTATEVGETTIMVTVTASNGATATADWTIIIEAFHNYKNITSGGALRGQYIYLMEAINAAQTGDTIMALDNLPVPAADSLTPIVGKVLTLTTATAGSPGDPLRCTAPATLTRERVGNLIQVNSGALTVTGIILDGNKANFANAGGALLYSVSNAVLTVSTGAVLQNNAWSGHGAAVYAQGSLSVDGATISNNTAGGVGGAIYAEAAVAIRGSTIEKNSTANIGGAIYASGTSVGLNISNSTIESNISGGWSAGAIFSETVNSFDTVTFKNNEALGGPGGVLYTDKATSIKDSIFENNAGTWAGGALYTIGAMTIEGGRFKGNSAGSGGAIYINEASLTISGGTVFESNRALWGNGGAVRAQGTNSAVKINISGSVFGGSVGKGNSASAGRGGALYAEGVNIADDAILNISNSDFSYNLAGIAGGGIWTSAYTTITDITVTHNRVESTTGSVFGAGITSRDDSVLIIERGVTGTRISDNSIYTSAIGEFIGAFGAGIYIGPTAIDNAFVITGAHIERNEAKAAEGKADGGGLWASCGGFLIDTSISYNTADGAGGGIYYTNTTLRDLAITRGSISANTAHDGAGLWSDANLDLDAVSIISNVATGAGGGIYFFKNTILDNNLHIESLVEGTYTDFKDNTAGDGGGIWASGDLLLHDATIEHNAATVSGGGIYVTGDGDFQIHEIIVEHNSAVDGGGLYITHMAELHQTEIRNNTASNNGGGVWISGDTNIIESIIHDNTALTGGGIWSSGDLVMVDTNVFLNTATAGGGAICVVSLGKTKIEGSAIYENTAGADGGALWTEQETEIIDTDFTKNTGMTGGAIYANTTKSFTMSATDPTTKNLISENTSLAGGALYKTGVGALDISNTIISKNTNTGGWAGGGIFTESVTGFDNVEIVENTAVVGGGGGLYSAALTTVINSEISRNTAVGVGGAIYASWASTGLIISGSTIDSNKTSGWAGGALYSETPNAFDTITVTNNETTTGSGGALYTTATTTITDSTFESNKAGWRGGALLTTGVVTIEGSTFSLNTAHLGGALHSEGTLSISDSTIGGNITGDVANVSAAIHNGGILNIKGALAISDTIYNVTGKFITVNGALTPAATPIKVWQMGATVATAPANGTIVVKPDGTAVSDVTHFVYKDTNLVLNPAAVTGNGGVVIPVFQLQNTRTDYLGSRQAMQPSTPNLIIEAIYAITYDGNGETDGTVPVDANLYMTGAPATVLHNTGGLVKIGYNFNAWNTASNGSGMAYAEGASISAVTADIDLYAHWKRHNYKIIYGDNILRGYYEYLMEAINDAAATGDTIMPLDDLPIPAADVLTPITKTVTLCSVIPGSAGEGYRNLINNPSGIATLTRKRTGNIIEVTPVGNLTTRNIILDGNKAAYPATDGAILHNNGRLAVLAGSILQNNSRNGNGAAIYSTTKTLKVEEAIIRWNKATGTSSAIYQKE